MIRRLPNVHRSSRASSVSGRGLGNIERLYYLPSDLPHLDHLNKDNCFLILTPSRDKLYHHSTHHHEVFNRLSSSLGVVHGDVRHTLGSWSWRRMGQLAFLRSMLGPVLCSNKSRTNRACDVKSSCMSTFTSGNCAGDGACFCKDTALIQNANSCINGSSCSASDKASK
jgi:hypothetical protein